MDSTKKLIQSVGTTLREVRKQQRLSLEELATKTGVSKLTLGNIERGDTNPTIGMMWKIANGLDVPLITLLQPEKEVCIIRAGEGVQIVEGRTWVIEPLFHHRGKVETYRAFLQPHSTYEPEQHPIDTVEMVTVMAGRLEIEIDDVPYVLQSYDTIEFIASKKHVYINTTAEPVVLHLSITYAS